MAQKLTRCKRKMLGIRIKPKEGLWIKYQLGIRDITLTEFGKQLGVNGSTVSSIIRGFRSSRRIEEAFRQTLGYPSFEAMIAAARGKGAV